MSLPTPMNIKTKSALLFVTGSLTFCVLSLFLTGCDGVLDSAGFGNGAGIGDYQDPLHPQYMATPTEVHFPDSALVYLTDEDYAQFKEDLFGFLDSNNGGRYKSHFQDYYIKETFATDSIFDMYVRMWGQWDSIGVSTRFDHWKLLYSSPFFEGEVYDVALAEVELRHHMVFQKRWTGNYKNFGRTMSERYPGASIEYMDTTFVDVQGDTVYRRHITAETQRLMYAARAHEDDTTRGGGIRWLNEGWNAVPTVAEVMDSSAVAKVLEHRASFGYQASQKPDSTGQL